MEVIYRKASGNRLRILKSFTPSKRTLHVYLMYSRLSGVIVNVLATVPRFAGSNPAEEMDF
jgi:hypothetical protein